MQFTRSLRLKLLAEGTPTVTTSNLPPVIPGTGHGNRLDLVVTPAEGQAHRGIAAGVVRKKKPRLLFPAADHCCFERHRLTVKAPIAPAHFQPDTTL